MEPRTRLFLPIVIIVAILAVSTASIFIRYAQTSGAPSLGIAALRLTFATLLIAPIALTRHLNELKRLTRTEVLLGLFSGLFLAAHFATWISSLEFTSVASSVVFVGTGPLWVALLSPVILKEHISRSAVFGLALAVLGGTIIGLADACAWNNGLVCPNLGEILQGRAMWGNFLALAGAWAVTGYLIIGRKLRSGISLMTYIFLVYGMGAAALVGFTFISGQSLLGYAPQAYGWIFLLAAIPQLIGHTSYNWALKYLSATMVAVSVLGEPIGSATLAFFLLNEIPSLMTIAGGILILIGIYFSSKGS